MTLIKNSYVVAKLEPIINHKSFPSLVSGLSGDNENILVDFFMRHPQQQSSQRTPTSAHSPNSIKDEINDEKRGSSISPSISVDESYACSQCSASFLNRDQLEKHELMHSPNSQQSVSCKQCHKAFANVYRLQRHMICHDESETLRKFKCHDCDKAFKFKHHLKEHIRIHTGEKPFGCRNCGKRFSHSGSHSSHMTSKKCIKPGLKMTNRSSKMDKPNSQKQSGFMSQQLSNVNNVGMHLNGLSLTENNNLSTSPNKNSFLPMPSLINKYGGYDVSALLAFGNFPPLSLMMDPRQSLQSLQNFQNLLSMTGAPSNMMDGFLNRAHHNKTPSLHSDPEDMIEEVTDDANEEGGKLVMDIDSDETEQKMQKLKVERLDDHPSPPISVSSPMPSPRSSAHERADSLKMEDSQSDNGPFQMKNNDLSCHRCGKSFNHRTELAQHETVLCGMLQKPEDLYAAAQAAAAHAAAQAAAESMSLNASFGSNSIPNQSSSEDERKVRVRTAISEEQQNILKEFYAKNPKPGREEFRAIAQILSLDSRVVQVWFQNNRSRERKMNGMGYGKQHHHQLYSNGQSTSVDLKATVQQSVVNTKVPLGLPMPQPLNANQMSPNSCNYSPVAIMDDQPLDLSIKKDGSVSTPSNSPRYGIASSDEVMNLSRKSLAQYPYMPPIGIGPMDPFFNFVPEIRRNMPDNLSTGSDKNSWKDEINFTKDTFNGSVSPKQQQHQQQQQQQIAKPPPPTKRSYVKQPVPEGESQHVCDECDKAFNKQSSLARHKYEHSGLRPYQCLECTKAFKHKHHLTEHTRLHTGEKPFQCSKCLKKFSHSGSYSQHMNHRYSYCKPYRDV